MNHPHPRQKGVRSYFLQDTVPYEPCSTLSVLEQTRMGGGVTNIISALYSEALATETSPKMKKQKQFPHM